MSTRFTASFIGWCLMSLTGVSASAQTPVQRLGTWTVNKAPEKIYLQTDKPYYAVGDTIWLSAFVADGITHGSAGISRVAYVQLIHSTGDLVEQRILSLSAGRGQAAIALNDSLPAGDYQLVAFTNWMRNQSADYFFRQNLPIGRSRPLAPAPPVAALSPDLRFFPEGGQLVAGLPCRVAFKALNRRGQSTAVSGVVVDAAEHDVAIPFRTTHDGMGLFFLTPQADRHYKAKLPDGTTYPLPPVQTQGMACWVENLPAQKLVRVTVYRSADDKGEARLLAHLRGRVCFEAIVPDALKTTAQIPYDKIPADGVLTLTLFDGQTRPRCERLVLINRQQQLRIVTTFDKTSYTAREPVTMTLTVTDAADQPVAADVSLAVTDADRVPLTDPFNDNLLSNWLLTADLPGHLEQPAYYVDGSQPQAGRDADLLLLTQGWRRFVWQQPDAVPRFGREDGLTLTGKVLRPDNKPASAGQVNMILSAGAASQFADVAIDSAGRFAVPSVNLVGPITVVARGLNQHGNQNRRVVLNPLPDFWATYQPSARPDSSAIPIPFLRAEQQQNQVAAFQLAGGRPLKQVDVKGKWGLPYWQDYRRNKVGEPDAIARQGNLPANTFLDILRQSKAGSRVYSRIITGSAPVYIYVDGVTVNQGTPYSYTSDPILTTAILPGQIEQIDIITNLAKMGVLIGTGTGMTFGSAQPMLINILTKQGDYRSSLRPTAIGLSVEQVMGYAPVREFYTPSYKLDSPTDSMQPDYRTTLFWMPRLTTDASGRATVTFANSDQAARLRVVVNGVDASGRVGTARTESAEKQ